MHDGAVITPSTCVRNLGVFFDSKLSMTEQINCVTCCCFYQLRQLRFIRRSLTQDTAKIFIHAFISRRIDYCNSLLFGATDQAIRPSHAGLNASARLITGIGLLDHIISVWRDNLHWQPVK